MERGITASADHALAIDIGTQAVRAILFDPSGNLVAMGRVPIEQYREFRRITGYPPRLS